MQVENKYISVKEFAERENISTQAVYKRLNTTLQPYVVKQGKITYIDYNAYLSQKNEPEPSQKEEQDIQRLYADKLKEVAELQQLNQRLQEENAEKEKQLLEQKAAYERQLREQAESNSARIDTLLATIQAEQALHAATVQDLKALQAATAETAEEQPAPSFWQRIFHKRNV